MAVAATQNDGKAKQQRRQGKADAASMLRSFGRMHTGPRETPSLAAGNSLPYAAFQRAHLADETKPRGAFAACCRAGAASTLAQ
jgi:hypothetical protein